MGWSLGPIEVIALIVFVGYAVTYSLHIAHKYGDASFIVAEEDVQHPKHAHEERDDEQDISGGLKHKETNDKHASAKPGHMLEFDKKPSLESGTTDSSLKRRNSKIGDDLLSPHTNLSLRRAESLELDPCDYFGGAAGEERFERTRFSLQRMGGAALGSALTTLGTAFFLLFCTLQIFKKLGSVIFTVTCLAIIFALTPLPAALIYAGPLWPGFAPLIDKARQVRNAYRKWKLQRKLGKHYMHDKGTDPKTPETNKGPITLKPLMDRPSQVTGEKPRSAGPCSGAFKKEAESQLTDTPGSSEIHSSSTGTWGATSSPRNRQETTKRVFSADDPRARQMTDLLDRIRATDVSSAPLAVDPPSSPESAPDAINARSQVIMVEYDRKDRCLEGCGLGLDCKAPISELMEALDFMSTDRPEQSHGNTGPVSSSVGSRGPAAPRAGSRGRAPSSNGSRANSRGPRRSAPSPQSQPPPTARMNR